MRKGKEKRAKSPMEMVMNAAIGSGLALGLSLILLFIASGLVVRGRLPEGFMGGTVVAVLFLTSLIGAFVAIRRNGGRALIVGVAEGAILYGVTFVLGAFAERQSLFGALSLFLMLATILGGVLAGLFCSRRKKRKI